MLASLARGWAAVRRAAVMRPWPCVVTLAVVALLVIYQAGGALAAAYDWPQFDGNAQHSGNNTQEGTITAGNVGTLRRLFQVSLPAVADSAPAYLAGASTPQGTKDLVVLTTRASHVLAIDAHTGTPVWSHQINGPNYTTSSPAIDPNRQYVYSYGIDGYVHKYTVGDGSEVTTGGWPELATLKPDVEKGSSALTIATARSGTSYLYVANGGYPGDFGDYQGHITVINLGTGTQRVFNTMCSNLTINAQPPHFVENGSLPADCPDVQSAVWARSGVVYDPATDKIYIATGNGAYTANTGGYDWGDSVLALNPDGSGVKGGPLDSYTPADYQFLQDSDTDLGSTAPALVPAPAGSVVQHVAVQGGKDAQLRLLNLDNLSGQGGPRHVGGEVGPLLAVPQGGEVLTAPAVWTNPADNAPWVFVANDSGISGLQVSVGAKGLPGLSTQWTNTDDGVCSSPAVANNVLYAACSNDIRALDPRSGALLWSSTQASAGGSIGGIHWESPVVANGVLYITDENAQLSAYTLPAATLAVNPTSGSPFQTVTVTGTNFGASEPIKVFWDSTATSPRATPTTTANGSFVANVTVPPAVAGKHTFIAVGQRSGQQGSIAIQVMPRLLSWPNAEPAGSPAAVMGLGFGATESVKVYWGPYPRGRLVGSAMTDAGGTFLGASAVTFTVPLSPTGIYPLYAIGQASHSGAYQLFLIPAPHLTLTPSTGAPGTSTVVSGAGFDRNETVQLGFCGRWFCTGGQILTRVQADATGAFSGVHVTIPVTATGPWPAVVALGASPTHVVWAPFALTGAPSFLDQPSAGTTPRDTVAVADSPAWLLLILRPQAAPP